MKFAKVTKFHRKSGGAQWRDLLFAHPISDAKEGASLPFVIPSAAEGSAVP